MDFASVRIIADDLDAMVEFYEKVTGISADCRERVGCRGRR